MANTVAGNRIQLDTFTSAIDVKSLRGDPSGFLYRVNFIEWQRPTAVAHVADVVDGEGLDVFAETCPVALQSIIKYFNGGRISNFKIAANGVSSGKIIICLAT